MVTTPRVTIITLSEDSPKISNETLEHIYLNMLSVAKPQFAQKNLSIKPSKDESVLWVTRANMWRSSNVDDRPIISRFLTEVATELVEGRFVFFHVDGDIEWARHNESINTKQFRELVFDKIEYFLNERRKDSKFSSNLIFSTELYLSRLVPIHPFYSLEAWLYQNTDVAIECCNKHHSGKNVAEFEAWKLKRELLDEVPYIKDIVCVQDRYNILLAKRAYPTQEVYDVKKSFYAAVEQIKACPELMVWL